MKGRKERCLRNKKLKKKKRNKLKLLILIKSMFVGSNPTPDTNLLINLTSSDIALSKGLS